MYMSGAAARTGKENEKEVKICIGNRVYWGIKNLKQMK